MRILGFWLMAFGCIYLLYAFNMDVAVSTTSTYVPGYGSVGGGTVANIDLMARRQNHVIVAGLVTLIGALMAIFGGRGAILSPTDVPAAIPADSDFEGARELASDPYRLWLAAKYGLERNSVFDRFVVGDATFETLESALSELHARELEIAAEKATELELRDARIADIEERARLTAEAEDAAWRQARPKVFVAMALGVIFLIGLGYVFMETPEQRAARLANLEKQRTDLIAGAEKQFGVKIPDDASDIQANKTNKETSFICDNHEGVDYLSFNSKMSASDIRDYFVKILGKGEPVYESLPDDHDWKWSHKKKFYTLNMFSETPPINVDLCMVDAKN